MSILEPLNQTTPPVISTIVMGTWHHRTLVKAGLGLSDVKTLHKLDGLYSDTDLAQLFLLNQIPLASLVLEKEPSLEPVQSLPWSNTEASNDTQLEEKLRLLDSLTTTDSIKQGLLDRLCNYNPMVHEPTKDPYQVITQHDTIFVVLNEGFLASMHPEPTFDCVDFKDKFIEDTLKACYTLAPICVVTGHSFFGMYLKKLRNDVTLKLV